MRNPPIRRLRLPRFAEKEGAHHEARGDRGEAQARGRKRTETIPPPPGRAKRARPFSAKRGRRPKGRVGGPPARRWLHDRRRLPAAVGVLLSAPHPALRATFPGRAGEGARAHDERGAGRSAPPFSAKRGRWPKAGWGVESSTPLGEGSRRRMCNPPSVASDDTFPTSRRRGGARHEARGDRGEAQARGLKRTETNPLPPGRAKRARPFSAKRPRRPKAGWAVRRRDAGCTTVAVYPPPSASCFPHPIRPFGPPSPAEPGKGRALTDERGALCAPLLREAGKVAEGPDGRSAEATLVARPPPFTRRRRRPAFRTPSGPSGHLPRPSRGRGARSR
ncbi:hypothetical protein DFR50_1162 [Roseiarcus fermentans]|uniref:Uncharacterized protein n=1 Tax=Roseiarcus fermentans TaxID=1473586 RepID=A0A366F9M6_9HYPH|nr:hypothetical protein DFR50_1162 [Roseiarcus fermentans]